MRSKAVSNARFLWMMSWVGNFSWDGIFTLHDHVESVLDFRYWLFIFNIVVFGCDTLPFRLGSGWCFIWTWTWSCVNLWLNSWLDIIWLSSLVVVSSTLFCLLRTHFIINRFLMRWLFNSVANSSLNLTVNKIFKLVLFLNTFTGRHLIYIMVVICWL